MQAITDKLIDEVLKADSTIEPSERRRIRSLISAGGTPTTEPSKPRIMRRAEVAAALGRSVRGVDLLAEQGIIEKVKFPGRTRAAGFRECDVQSLING